MSVDQVLIAPVATLMHKTMHLLSTSGQRQLSGQAGLHDGCFALLLGAVLLKKQPQ
jgi:hypothetical protein